MFSVIILVFSVLLVFGILTGIFYLAKWIDCKHFMFAYHPAHLFIASLIITLLFFLYGYSVGRWKMEVKQTEIAFATLPKSFDKYRIVQISDIHAISFIDHEDKLQKLVDTINALQPDLICIVGDLVNIHPNELETTAPILSQLKATDGVVSVLGNHDLANYMKKTDAEKRALVDTLIEKQKQMGWKMLNNESIVIQRDSGEKITVVGVVNKNYKFTEQNNFRTCDLPKALENTDGFRILLTHNPQHWHDEVRNLIPIDLSLSGHTHNAQVAFFGCSPSAWMYTEHSGLYENTMPKTDFKQYIYVTNGVGCTIPMRIGVPQEVTVLDLRCKTP